MNIIINKIILNIKYQKNIQHVEGDMNHKEKDWLGIVLICRRLSNSYSNMIYFDLKKPFYFLSRKQNELLLLLQVFLRNNSWIL